MSNFRRELGFFVLRQNSNDHSFFPVFLLHIVIMFSALIVFFHLSSFSAVSRHVCFFLLFYLSCLFLLFVFLFVLLSLGMSASSSSSLSTVSFSSSFFLFFYCLQACLLLLPPLLSLRSLSPLCLPLLLLLSLSASFSSSISTVSFSSSSFSSFYCL